MPLRPDHRVTFENGVAAQLMAIDGTWRLECIVHEVSEFDARISVATSISGLHLREFFLLLSSPGLAYRRCAMDWINGNQIGAKFLAPKNKKRPAPPPRVDRNQLIF